MIHMNGITSMILRNILYPCLFITVLILSACAGEPIPEVVDGQYWQRSNASEATYMQGAKAQALLNRSIARCVVELRELERLGMVRNAIPADVNGRVLDPDQMKLDEWDSPERDGELYAEHFDYQDFEGCMLAKGWERVEYLPYDMAERARQEYLKAQYDYRYGTNFGEQSRRIRGEIPTSQNSGQFGNLNN